MSELEQLGETLMPFGNYKGKPLKLIYRIDPDYLMWARDNLKPPIGDKIADYMCLQNQAIVERGKVK